MVECNDKDSLKSQKKTIHVKKKRKKDTNIDFDGDILRQGYTCLISEIEIYVLCLTVTVFGSKM